MQHEVFFKKMTSHGSINVPIKLRRELGIENKDPMTVQEQDGVIVIKPYLPRCVICGSEDVGFKVHGKGICRACMSGAQPVPDVKKEDG